MKTAVIGGGAAGIAAALKAASLGHQVTLYEALPRLGGRLGSFTCHQTGRIFDFGEHLLLASCAQTLKLLELMNCRYTVRVQPKLEIPFHHPRKGFHLFRLNHLPKPYDFLWALGNFKYLPFPQRLKLITRLKRLIDADNLPAISAEKWLEGASPAEYRNFWLPLILSALNCLPGEADIGMLKTVFCEGFLKGGGLGFFTIPQNEIFHHRALKALETAGVELKIRESVSHIALKEDGVEIYRGTDVIDRFDRTIVAVPPEKLPGLLGDQQVKLGIDVADIGRRYSAICNVHLVFAEPVFESDFGCLLESLPQWYFRKRWISPEAAYSLVISAADAILPKGGDIIGECLRDLERCGGNMRNNKVHYAKMVLIKRATVKFPPAARNQRPKIETGDRRLLLAGDWVDTGLPPTIESAITSGFRAAEML